MANPNERVAVVALWQADQVYLQRRTHDSLGPDLYGFYGGLVERKDNWLPRRTAVREVLEESGIKLHPIRLSRPEIVDIGRLLTGYVYNAGLDPGEVPQAIEGEPVLWTPEQTIHGLKEGILTAITAKYVEEYFR